jgi:hypothetical protein
MIKQKKDAEMRLFLLVLTYDSHSRREGRAEHTLKSSKSVINY